MKGYTLVELVTVVLLLGVLAAVAIPRMFNPTAFQSRGFFDEVVNAARYGQKLAVASGCEVQLSVSAAGYALHQRNGGCTIGAFTLDVPQPGGSGSFAGAPPPGVALLASNPAVVFNARGQARPAGVTVSVDGRDFTIDAESGYVSGL